MPARPLPRLGWTATLVAALGSPGWAGAQEPTPVPTAPLPPGAPGLPQLRPDTAGTGAIEAARRVVRSIVVREPGPGMGGRTLRAALEGPHLLVVAGDSGLTLGRDVRVGTTLVVLGPARVAATIRGDLVVVGPLWLRPGALIEGRAIAIGGDVAPSTLARVGRGTLAYRDLAVTVRENAVAVRALRPDAPRLTLPGTGGVRLPSYDRIDGLSLAFGPELALDTGRVRIDPTLTYRSHLGALDPALTARFEPGPRLFAELRALRGTLTNDAWSRGDAANSVTTLGTGSDARNYHRADRADVTVGWRVAQAHGQLEPFVGALVERAWSVARDSLARSAPWSLLNRADRREGVLRPNPAVTGGRLASALAGVRWRSEAGGVQASAGVQVEQALAVTRGGRFTQGTADAQITFPGFRDHRVDAFAHAVLTGGDAVPSQRYAYLGGGSTLPSLYLLEQGGDQLLWVETRYTVPLSFIALPFAGSPAFTLRHAVGGAGVGHLPTLTQNLGLRLAVSVLRVDYAFDPSGRGRRQLSLGVGFR